VRMHASWVQIRPGNPKHFEAARHDGLADQAGGRAAAPES